MVINTYNSKMENQTAGHSNKDDVDGNNNANNNGAINKNHNREFATTNTDKCSDTVNARIATVTANVKYQLRPRSLQARRFCETDWSFPDTIMRHKPRPAPLSRYRRKTANARERHRMRQINTAFESLRGVLPSWVCSRRAASDLTKITTLKLASAYIRALEDILDGNADEETYPWVLSNILNSSSSPTPLTKKESPKVETPPPPSPAAVGTIKTQLSPPYPSQESDLVSLLCSSSSATVLEDSLEFSYLTSDCDDMNYFLGCESPKNWQSPQQHTPLVT